MLIVIYVEPDMLLQLLKGPLCLLCRSCASERENQCPQHPTRACRIPGSRTSRAHAHVMCCTPGSHATASCSTSSRMPTSGHPLCCCCCCCFIACVLAHHDKCPLFDNMHALLLHCVRVSQHDCLLCWFHPAPLAATATGLH